MLVLFPFGFTCETSYEGFMSSSWNVLFFHHALGRNCLFSPLAGIEVPAGKPVTCVPGEGMYLHVSQVLLDLTQFSSF